jgi:nucleotide-binding universal stress UspA family protein
MHTTPQRFPKRKELLVPLDDSSLVPPIVEKIAVVARRIGAKIRLLRVLPSIRQEIGDHAPEEYVDDLWQQRRLPIVEELRCLAYRLERHGGPRVEISVEMGTVRDVVDQLASAESVDVRVFAVNAADYGVLRRRRAPSKSAPGTARSRTTQISS